MTTASDTLADVSSSDIVFECPHCGKSLAIDARGQGMLVVCPDCQSTVQVPGIAMAGQNGLARSTQVGAEEHAMLVGESTDFRELITRELELIQAAMDRIVGFLQQYK